MRLRRIGRSNRYQKGVFFMKKVTLHKLSLGIFLIAAFTLTSTQAIAQTDDKDEATVAVKEESNLPKPAAMPALTELKGVAIGMTDDQVREKLGKPASADASSMVYTFDNGETIQLGLDTDKKVRMIAAIFSGKGVNAPDAKSVFVDGPAIEPTSDGRFY
jgi:hypothetical protein